VTTNVLIDAALPDVRRLLQQTPSVPMNVLDQRVVQSRVENRLPASDPTSMPYQPQ
jgi:hypothetical protein